jgi:hypothetical protein
MIKKIVLYRAEIFKVTPKLKRKINTLAKRVGVALNWKRAPGLQWNGNDIACKGQDASNIIHDIAHYAVATPRARECWDFGLGPGPDTLITTWQLQNLERSIFPREHHGRICNEIESQASALGIHWEKELGLPWEKTAEYHDWDFEDLKRSQAKLKDTIDKCKEK